VGYLDFDIETDVDTIAQLAYDEMASRISGWDPIVGEIDTAIIQAVARVAAQVRASAGIVPVGVFRYLATQFGMTPILALPATGLATITALDTLGHTLPAGAQFTITDASGDDQAFQTVSDAVLTAGVSVLANVPITAVTPGVDGNSMPYPGVLEPVDAIAWLSAAATQITSTSGGLDAETDDEFLDRLVTKYLVMSATPILPIDFAIMALDVLPVGSRTYALDGYDAVALTSANARTITVFAVDQNGNALSSPTAAAVVAYLAANREVNWLVYCSPPAFAAISVKFTAHALPGYTASLVLADAIAAVTSYLTAKNWGVPTVQTPNNWTLAEGYDKVRLGELYQVLNAVNGLAYVDTLFLKAGAVAPTTEILDVVLAAGVIPTLPTPGSITGTVT
jgi:hypothetical protein